MSLHKHSNLLIIFIKHIPIGKYMNGFKTHFYAKHVESIDEFHFEKKKVKLIIWSKQLHK